MIETLLHPHRLLLLSVVALLCASPEARSQKANIAFEHLTVEQGLSSSTVNSICQDSKGFMWFGTNVGLNRFDGYTCAVFKHDPRDSNSLSGNFISAIHEDRSGRLWVTVGGEELNEFDRATEKFTRYLLGRSPLQLFEDSSGTIWAVTNGAGLWEYNRSAKSFVQYKHEIGNPKSLSNDTLLTICEDKSYTLWLGTEHGIDKFDRPTQTFTHYAQPTADRVNSIIEDHDGMLWLGTNNGLVRFDRATGSFTRYRNSGSGSLDGGWNDINFLFESSRRELWVSTAGGIARFDHVTGSFRNFSGYLKDLPQYFTFASKPIYEDRSGTLWSIVFRRVARFDRDKGDFVLYVQDPRNPRSLNSDISRAIYEDNAGRVWFGLVGGGVDRYDRARKPFEHHAQNPFDSIQLSYKTVLSILEDEGGILWVGTPRGLHRFDNKKGSHVLYKHEPKNPHSMSQSTVWKMVEDRPNVLWLGTWQGGLNKFDRTTGRSTRYRYDGKNPGSISSDIVLSLCVDKSRTLWVGTSAGVLERFNSENGTFTHYRVTPGWVDISAIIEDRSSSKVWVGTSGKGLFSFDKSTATFKHYPDVNSAPRGLSSATVNGLYQDKRGVLWVATIAGLNRLDNATATFTHITSKDGLSSDIIYGILEDDAGSLWLSTSNGISTFTPGSGRIRNYNASDGVPIKTEVGTAWCQNQSGELFFGGENGFIRFLPDSIKDNPYVPPVVITAFKKFDKLVSLDSAISEKRLIAISYKENVFSFEFSALNYTSPEKNQYAYKLEGFDNDWTYCGTRRYATYTNLDGGSYIFRVKGSNNDGIWNEESTSIAVIITPPIWETWWFRTLAFAAMLVSVGGSVRYVEMRKLKRRIERLEQEQAIERERLRISRDMHDEVGATLTEIAILSELAQTNMRKTTEAQAQVQKIAERSRQVIDNIGEIIWAINPKNDHLVNIASYLRTYAMQYLSHSSIRCRADFPESVPEFHLSAESRRNIFLVVKEALHNVVKHSEASEVVLRLTVDNCVLAIVIEDNGKGFPPHGGTREGIGLHSMEKRTQDIGGTITFEPNQPSGVRVYLHIPMASADVEKRRWT